MTDNRFRLWAVLKTALTWAAAWGLAGGGIVAILSLIFPGPNVHSLGERIGMILFAGFGWGIRFALAGAVIGTLFSTVIRLNYRGRRLADINPVRFTLLGAIAGGVGVPLFYQMMNVVFGDGPIAWNLVTDDAVWASVFGAAAAAGSIWLARRAEALPGQGAGAKPLEAGGESQRVAGDHPQSAAAPIHHRSTPETTGQHRMS